jgi:hypothetical protein
MITIRISNASLDFERTRDIDENWIIEQISRRQQAGNELCVRVSIKEDPLHMTLSSNGCNKGPGGSRAPNSQEEAVFDLWDKVGMDKAHFTGGNLLAFLKQLRRFIN